MNSSLHRRRVCSDYLWCVRVVCGVVMPKSIRIMHPGNVKTTLWRRLNHPRKTPNSFHSIIIVRKQSTSESKRYYYIICYFLRWWWLSAKHSLELSLITPAVRKRWECCPAIMCGFCGFWRTTVPIRRKTSSCV